MSVARQHLMRIVMISIASLLISVTRMYAVTYYVAPDGNDGAVGTSWPTALRTISNGVANAGADDEVVLSNGTYYLTTFVAITNSITVRGWTGNREDVIVDGNFPTTTNRCFYLSHNDAVVADLTITNGFAKPDPVYVTDRGRGGGVYINYKGTVRNCVIAGNTATNDGGGVFMYRPNNGWVTNCAIVGNVASNDGGGIYFYASCGQARNCVISNNTAYSGGGVYVINSMDGDGIKDCEIVNNQASRGGGLYTATRASVTNCLIKNNCASLSGGGIFQNLGTVADCQIIGNSATIQGGGIHMWQANKPKLFNCMIAGNTARDGAGIYTVVSLPAIRNCLISGNVGSTSGGIEFNSAATAVNCTVVANLSTNNTGGVRCDGAGSLLNCVIYTNMVLNGTNYNVYNTSVDCTYSNCVTFPTAGLPGAGNIQADPMFVDPAGDFHLRTRSPCIDAGQNQTWMDTATDLDGNPRRYDGSTVDIGCYEYEPPPSGTVFIGL